jgi:2-hydroxy-6-oxonona-2,4-dienedioate hydrolase
MPLGAANFIDVAGTRTRYFEQGSGEPLVLLHGSNFGADLSADCAINWCRNFQGLAKFAHVVALDRLGQGLTENPKRLEDYTMDAVAEHAARFIRALNLEPVHLVGHSRGGYVAARMTLQYPELIKTCIIVDSLTLAPGIGGMAAIVAGIPEPRLTKESQRWVFERYSYSTDHIDDEWLDEVVAVAATPKYREAVGLVCRSSFDAHLAKQKPETLTILGERGIGKPTLVVWSVNDPTATIDQGYALYKIIAGAEPRSQMHIFNRSGHFTYREHPEEFNQLLRGWIAMNC